MKQNMIVCGAGIVGMATALGLARAGVKDVMLLGPAPKLPLMDRNTFHPRVYAISAASEKFLSELGVWSLMNTERVTRVEAMEIKGDAFGALYLRAWQAAQTSLTWIVESGEIERVLQQALKVYGVHWIEDTLEAFERGCGQTNRGTELQASLWVAADGARSKLREFAGLRYDETSYDAVGVVGHLTTEFAHQASAFQWFRPEGVLGILPMPDTDDGHQVSMVWSLKTAYAETLLAMSAERQREELAESLGKATRGRLGRMTLRSQLHGFALTLASSPMIGENVALVGDAAHRVHPLAGQGLNLGLGDAQALVEVLIKREPFLSVGDPTVLRRYRRSRAQALLEMRLVTDGLKRLFDQTLPPLPWLRNAGMSLVDRIPMIKRLLIEAASRSA
ncbi:FAD-dependent monooxygenase [Orrella daihaiensis]|uniref:FAD-dependent monooxygenase n=1 Tax=Orrella daihaiensis TaxID=2782176 RepID=A0ABY4AMJ8_9BURK|nr:FAD-dependent monooxygenase [Orrella daihaiensis]UOD50305.1 FAD-dependent monooxygenase [Orrella daihaiensis]